MPSTDPPEEAAQAGPPSLRAYVGLGANLGDVVATLNGALDALAELPGTRLEAVSSLYRTKPVNAAGPDYLNAVAALQSSLGPHELLRALHRIEDAHARVRPHVNAPRTLDLDLLWFGGAQRNGPLVLPHPRMLQRAFVLEPLAEVISRMGGDAAMSGLLRGSWPSPEARRQLAEAQGVERLGAWHEHRPGAE